MEKSQERGIYIYQKSLLVQKKLQSSFFTWKSSLYVFASFWSRSQGEKMDSVDLAGLPLIVVEEIHGLVIARYSHFQEKQGT